jgi:hypothetical protein
MGREKSRLNIFGEIEWLIRCKPSLKLDVVLSENFLVVFNKLEQMKFKINIKFYLLLKELDNMPLSQTREMDLDFPTIALLLAAESQVNLTKKNMLSKKDQKKAKEIRSNTNLTDYDTILKLICDELKITLLIYESHRNACKDWAYYNILLLKRKKFENHMTVAGRMLNYHFHTQMFCDYRLRFYYTPQTLSNSQSGIYKLLICSATENKMSNIDLANFLRLYFCDDEKLKIKLEDFLLTINYNEKKYTKFLYEFYLHNKIGVINNKNYLTFKLLELELESAFKFRVSSYFFEVDAKNSCVNVLALLFRSKGIGLLSGLLYTKNKKDFYTYVLNKIPIYLRSHGFENDSHDLYPLLTRKLIKKSVVAFFNSQTDYGRFLD